MDAAKTNIELLESTFEAPQDKKEAKEIYELA
jgi:hypothetical protein